MKKIQLITLLFCTMLSVQVIAQVKPDQILGKFYLESPLSDDEAKVAIEKAPDGTYYARVLWVNNDKNPDGTPRTDVKNPDPKLRNRQATDVNIFWNLKFKKDEWVDGDLYDPFSGKTLGVKVKLHKNGKDLKVRYYKGTPALGLTNVWTRLS